MHLLRNFHKQSDKHKSCHSDKRRHSPKINSHCSQPKERSGTISRSSILQNLRFLLNDNNSNQRTCELFVIFNTHSLSSNEELRHFENENCHCKQLIQVHTNLDLTHYGFKTSIIDVRLDSQSSDSWGTLFLEKSSLFHSLHLCTLIKHTDDLSCAAN